MNTLAPTGVERSPVPGAGLEDLDMDALIAFVRRRLPSLEAGAPIESAAVKLGLLCRAGAGFLPTTVGLLCFGTQPQLFQPQWGVSCARFDGGALSDAVVGRADLEGPLGVLADQAMAFVVSHSRMVDGAEEAPELACEYPPCAVHEGIVNALIHRDLRMTGRVAVRLFDDRLEIWSPGRLPTLPGDLEEIAYAGGVSLPRNALLAATARQLGLGEQLGRGLPTIKREIDRRGERSVELRASRADVLLTLPSLLPMGYTDPRHLS